MAIRLRYCSRGHLDYKRGDIKAQIEEMAAKDLLTIQQVKSIDSEKIRLLEIYSRVLKFSSIVQKWIKFSKIKPKLWNI